MVRILVSLLLVVALVVNSAAAGIEALVASVATGFRLAVQSEPDPFNEAPPQPQAPFTVGLDDTRNGIWTAENLTILGEMEAANETVMGQASGIPATSAPIYFPPPPSYEESNTAPRRNDDLPPSLQASVEGQSQNGDPGGGPPLPWEAAFPGGGSNSVETTVNSNTRNLTLRVPIFAWKMRGGNEVDFSLYYNSRGMTWTRFGRNWSSTFDATIYKNIAGLKLIVRWGDGSSMPFSRPNLQTNTFTTEAGIHQTIVYDSSAATYTLTTKTGMKYVFSEANSFWSYLTQIKERLSTNVITITRASSNPSGILSVSDDKSRISFDGNGNGGGNIYGIRDFSQSPEGGNRRWVLGYGSGGGLTSITYPTINSQTPVRSFTYLDTGNGRQVMQTETDVRGKTWKWQIGTTGIVGGYWTPILNDGIYGSPAYSFAVVDDKLEYRTPNRYEYGGTLSSTEKHQYDTGRIVNVYDAAGFFESYAWNSTRHIGSYTDRRRKSWVYLTDTNGNVTQITEPAVGGESIVEKFEYDEFSNLIWSYSDQVGLSTHKYEYTSSGRLQTCLGQLVQGPNRRRPHLQASFQAWQSWGWSSP